MEPRDRKGIDPDDDSPHLSKTEIRRRFAGLRAASGARERERFSSLIAGNFFHSALFAEASKIALYSPLGSEVDTSRIFSDLINGGKRVFFPRVCGDKLRFFEVDGSADLCPGSFGISEPSADSRREIAVSGLDLLLVPGICFDRFGSRIGYGKGFYDKATADLSAAKVCAPAYSFQFVDFELPSEPHDRRVGFVITERGVFRAKTKRKGEKND